MEPTGGTRPRRSVALETRLFALALTVSSALLFVIEPLLGKLVLPTLGATPAIWTTCMLFFQAALLAGYAYVRTDPRPGSSRRQAVVRIGVAGDRGGDSFR